jgi:CheY-like chemotaxis protein
MNQQVICEHLSRVGIRTVIADNGKYGVEMVQQRKESGEKQFDLIFMDIHMPEMDGIEAASKILELDGSITIIAMTANIFSSDTLMYKDSGMNDCVGKPFTSHELWRCLLRYLKPVKWQPVNGNGNGNTEKEVHYRILEKFVKDNKNRFNEIEIAIKNNDIKLAHRMVHNLKSNAGQFGKTLLQQAAENVEQQLKDGENRLTEKDLKNLESELNLALTQFESELEANPSKELYEELSPLDASASLELLKKLEPLLEMGSAECHKFINDLSRIPESGKLAEQIDDLDFEKALVSIAELKKKLKGEII